MQIACWTRVRVYDGDFKNFESCSIRCAFIYIICAWCHFCECLTSSEDVSVAYFFIFEHGYAIWSALPLKSDQFFWTKIISMNDSMATKLNSIRLIGKLCWCYLQQLHICNRCVGELCPRNRLGLRWDSGVHLNAPFCITCGLEA